MRAASAAATSVHHLVKFAALQKFAHQGNTSAAATSVRSLGKVAAREVLAEELAAPASAVTRERVAAEGNARVAPAVEAGRCRLVPTAAATRSATPEYAATEVDA